jgi:hypothetical protein
MKKRNGGWYRKGGSGENRTKGRKKKKKEREKRVESEDRRMISRPSLTTDL